MVAGGLEEEVRSLLAAGVPADAPSMSSIGYREFARVVAGECSAEEARRDTIAATRRLVRRQRQWFRAGDPRIRWVREAGDIELEANIFTGVCTNVLRRPG
jgi:tRNA dimethylallyltransferase